MAKEFEYHQYPFQDGPRGESSKAQMAAMSAAGWEVNMPFSFGHELWVLWERELSANAARQAKGSLVDTE